MARPRLEGTTQLKFRVPNAIRDGLRDAAVQNGRSLNAEITERLAQSLRPKRYWETMENPHVNALVDLVAQVIYAAGHNAGSLATLSSEGSGSWYSNSRAYDQVIRATEFALKNMRPKTSRLAHDETKLPAILDEIGEVVARGILQEVIDAKSTDLEERKERGNRLARDLGDEIIKNIRANMRGTP